MKIVKFIPLTILTLCLISCSFSQPHPKTTNNKAESMYSISQKKFQGIFTTLDNGLKVVIDENHTTPVVAFRVYVKTGSINEGEFIGCGLSHYCEHLVHAGTTKNRTEEENKLALTQMGGNTNAYTRGDHTCYHIVVSSQNLEKVAELFSDWMFNCTFNEDEVNREKGVILREIGMGQDEVNRVIWQLFNETMFKVSNSRIPVIGYKNNFNSITRDQVVSYYHKYYVPNNMVVSIVGDINKNRALNIVNKYFGQYERKPLPERILPKEPPQISTRIAVKEFDLNVSIMMCGYHTVSLQSNDMYPLDILSFILANNESSRLYQRLVLQNKLAYEISSSSITPYYADGMFIFRILTDYNRIEEIRKIINEELQNIAINGVSVAELQNAKTQIVSSYFLYNQTVENQASEIGNNVLSLDEPNFRSEYLEKINNVSIDDIKMAAKKYFYDDNLSIAILKPFSKSKNTDTTTKETYSTKGPFDNIKKVTLNNGLTILVKNNPELPVVSFNVVFKGGVRFEPINKNGITSLMTKMMFKGTQNMTADEINQRLVSMGTKFSQYCGNNSFGFSFEVLTPYTNEVIDLISEIIQNPSFPANELNMLKPRIIASIKNRKSDWTTEIHDIFRKEFFGKHPYSKLNVGNENDINGITISDLKDYYAKSVTPHNCVISVFGDVDATEISEKFKGITINFTGEKPIEPNIPSHPKHDKRMDVRFPTEKKQSSIIIAYDGATMNSDDAFALSIIDAITSGINLPSGWIYNALRGENNLVYYVHAINWTGLDPGSFYIMTQCTPDKREKVVSLILEQIERTKKGEFTDEEIQKAKNMCITNFKFNLQTNNDVGFAVALDEVYGFGYDADKNYVNRINAITKEDLINVSRKYLNSPIVYYTEPEEVQKAD